MANQKKGGKKNTADKAKNKNKNSKKTAEQQRKEENTRSLGVVLMLFGLIFALWFVVAFCSNIVDPAMTLGEKILQTASFVCNFGMGLLLVYLGFSCFVQKERRISGWQLVGWVCVFLAVGGMLHLSHCESGFS